MHIHIYKVLIYNTFQSQNNIAKLQQQNQPAFLSPSLASAEGEATTSDQSPLLFTTNAEFCMDQINPTYQPTTSVNNLAITETPLTYAQVI